jgi:hypothetical protein
MDSTTATTAKEDTMTTKCNHSHTTTIATDRGELMLKTIANDEGKTKQTVHCCNDCGCEVDYDTGYCGACDAFPEITSVLVEEDDRRPESHTLDPARSGQKSSPVRLHK